MDIEIRTATTNGTSGVVSRENVRSWCVEMFVPWKTRLFLFCHTTAEKLCPYSCPLFNNLSYPLSEEIPFIDTKTIKNKRMLSCTIEKSSSLNALKFMSLWIFTRSRMEWKDLKVMQ